MVVAVHGAGRSWCWSPMALVAYGDSSLLPHDSSYLLSHDVYLSLIVAALCSPIRCISLSLLWWQLSAPPYDVSLVLPVVAVPAFTGYVLLFSLISPNRLRKQGSVKAWNRTPAASRGDNL
jgi:hypothetical protein